MATRKFKAESQRLLDLMINSIYTNQEIFLRELISNASDALDKRYYLSLTNHEQDPVEQKDLKITIERHPDIRTLVIEDSGIGMTDKEMESNLGTIAKSGSADFKEKLEKAQDNIDIIGQFGVGFYSAFMVARKVTVQSHAVGSDKAYQWQSEGKEGYTITEVDKPSIGTRITLELKEDTDDNKYSDYLEEYKIRSLIKKYSDYVRYPIEMEVSKSVPDPTDEEKTIDTQEVETLNSMIPLWKKDKKSITKDEYNEFYKANFNDWENPLKVIHYSVEGTLSYTALLFIPSQVPYNFYYTDFQPGLKLYSKGVFIMDHTKDLLSDSFRFVQGLVDSDDLNLNISRETLQQDRQVKALARSIDKKIQSTLEDMLKNDRENYEKFWENFGLNLKFGVYQDYGAHKDKLQDLLLFRSSKEGKYVTLKEYTDRMPADQKEIYYAVGKTVADIEKMPVIARIHQKGYEVLYFLDERDEFVSGILQNYADKPFKSVNKGDLDLDTEEEKQEKEKEAAENKDLLSAIQKDLDGKVKEVRISSRLVDDPVCLVSDEGVSLEMEKYLSRDPMNKGIKATKILEINPKHPIFKKLQTVYANDPDSLKDYADILYDQALLIQGLDIEDPAAYTRKIVQLMVDTKDPEPVVNDAEDAEPVQEAEVVEDAAPADSHSNAE